MKFRTEYMPVKAGFTLSPDRGVMMLGSCFADNMRMKMSGCLWRARNPLGTLYNPLSIERSLRLCLGDGDREADFRKTLFSGGGIVHSWLFDSRLSSDSECRCAALFSGVRESVVEGLRDAEALFVTFGTSHCYYLSGDEDHIVANCHKQPASLFGRRRLSVEEIADVWEKLVKDLHVFNPELRIVFTVSPVRHMKDGFEGNARSKAVLLLAIDELCRRDDSCTYFPAYEIVNDDLRDYRYYASDLVHPSEQAVEYLWEIFRATYLDRNGEQLVREGESLAKAYRHRQLIGGDEAAAEWRRKVDVRYDDFLMRHPGMLDLRKQSPC